MTVLPIGTRIIPGQGDLAINERGHVWKLKPEGWVRLSHDVRADSLWYERTWPLAASSTATPQTQ